MAWSNERQNKVFGGIYSLPIRCRTTTRTLGTTPGDKDLLATYIASKAPDAKSKAEELANTYVPTTGVDDIPDEEKNEMITMFPRGKFLRRVDDPTIFYDPLYDVVPNGVKTEEVIVPFIWDYQFRGSFKESIAFLQRASKNGKAPKIKVPKEPKEPKRKRAMSDEDYAKAMSDYTRALAEYQEVKREADEAAAIAASTKTFAATDITAYKKTVDGGWFIKQRRIPMLVPETYIDEMGNEHSTYDDKGRLPIWTRPLRADTAQGPRVCLASSEFVPAGTEYYLCIQLLNASDAPAMIETLDFKEKVGMLQWRGGGNGTFVWTPADMDGKPVDREV